MEPLGPVRGTGPSTPEGEGLYFSPRTAARQRRATEHQMHFISRGAAENAEKVLARAVTVQSYFGDDADITVIP